jgi:hypothetical protein
VKTAKRKTTRPRGFAPWTPRAQSLELLEQVRSVLTTFRAYLPVTVRQIFYRLVATLAEERQQRERVVAYVADFLEFLK